eukprot:2180532-Pleurochrysis_carterae.AAC.1
MRKKNKSRKRKAEEEKQCQRRSRAVDKPCEQRVSIGDLRVRRAHVGIYEAHEHFCTAAKRDQVLSFGRTNAARLAG